MNTKEIQNQIATLKQADLAAYKAGVKSNFVIDFVRNELIKRAFAADENLKKEFDVELNMTVASYIASAIALMTKDGQYPKLLSKAVQTYKDGDIVLTCKINAAGLSDEYRAKLNDKLDIKIPV